MFREKCDKCRVMFRSNEVVLFSISAVADSAIIYISRTLKERFHIDSKIEYGKLVFLHKLKDFQGIARTLKKEDFWWKEIFYKKIVVSCQDCRPWPSDLRKWRRQK